MTKEVWYLKKIRELQNEVKGLKQDNEEKDEKIDGLEKENKELRKKLEDLAKQKSSKKPKFSIDYSVGKQERLKNGEKGKSTGRRTLKEKMKYYFFSVLIMRLK